jgi:hypothetical protein
MVTIHDTWQHVGGSGDLKRPVEARLGNDSADLAAPASTRVAVTA